MSEVTIFDKILAGSIPASTVYEDDKVKAFRDISPVAPVHVLVIPKKKVASLAGVQEWSAADAGEFLIRVSKVASELGLDRSGYRVVMNHGRDGGQTVHYLHAHILGGRELSWPPG